MLHEENILICELK